jgi:F-box protein 9
MEETEELRRFREDWKREVNTRLHSEQPTTSSPPATRQATQVHTPAPDVEPTASQNSIKSDLPRPLVSINSASASRRASLDLYAQAVQAESQGQLDRAIGLYRRAFRLDGNVDKAYYRASLEREVTSEFGTLSIHTSKGKEPLRTDPSEAKQLVLPHKRPLHYHALQSILDAFPSRNHLAFLPEVENQPVHINKLPDELLVLILHCFIHTADTRSIERFALVARRARVLTLDSSLWRYV